MFGDGNCLFVPSLIAFMAIRTFIAIYEKDRKDHYIMIITLFSL